MRRRSVLLPTPSPYVKPSTCPCGKAARSGQRTCHECHRAYMRRQRLKNRLELERLRKFEKLSKGTLTQEYLDHIETIL
jgi:hypothetical protein